MIKIENSTTGTLLYDAVNLEPHYGPGMSYAADYRFDLKEGEQVRVFTVANDQEGNQWVLVEGKTAAGMMRVYLLYYEASKSEYKMKIEEIEILA